jgi:DNA-binding MarR family transcriptional regulator
VPTSVVRAILAGVMERPARQISLLFDVFVVNQRLRHLLARALADTGLRPDEYAVYSVLFELGPLTPTEMSAHMGMPLTTVLDYVHTLIERGHASRDRHPRDSRSYHVRLTPAGLTAHGEAGAAWNEAVLPLESALEVPIEDVRKALHALEDAAATALNRLIEDSIRATG